MSITEVYNSRNLAWVVFYVTVLDQVPILTWASIDSEQFYELQPTKTVEWLSMHVVSMFRKSNIIQTLYES